MAGKADPDNTEFILKSIKLLQEDNHRLLKRVEGNRSKLDGLSKKIDEREPVDSPPPPSSPSSETPPQF